MEKRSFGNTHREVAVIGQGTWNMDEADPALALAAMRRGIDCGMTHIDCAEMYGSGAAETLVGEAISGRREEIFLVSKVLPSHASRSGVIAACEKSLARLKTDRLDCYLLHWRGNYPLQETVAGFEKLQQAGKILSWGVSNFDVPDLEELREVTDGKVPACNQVLYHLGERAIEHAVIPWCEEQSIAVVAYSPFGHRGGFPSPRSSKGRVLQEIADAHGVTARTVALRFLVRRPPVFAIPMTSNPEHAAGNAASGELQLNHAELARIEAAFPLGPRPRSLPML